MAKKCEFHQEFSKLPATGYRAREIGEIYYFTGKRCSKGHLSPRYASSGNCVECIAKNRGKAEINKRGRSSIRSAENQLLAIAAINDGKITYESVTPCPKGHTERYVAGNACLECNRISMSNRSEYLKWLRIKKEYGLTKEDVENLFINQDGKCAICDFDISKKYHIDHCHKNGHVRGLLCSKCNHAIGLLKESEILFKKAAQYIRDRNAS